ncbi:hypothetical protein HWHPT5561_06625 [Petrotoga sp. HWH.PT.55.6.1]|uniref:dTDP-4-dehydrorhamnose 3,5-epimerase family protein n=1 Tax=unclassified Petrotoga TaxID=2620614 RepID=UPI000CA08FFA|nr:MULTISPECIES: dTDP-4-dehydrorhamnose 3,5-epimerase family protein [unclassified Petrotoga]PNR91817.1 dTDP-4-dehydrorhamnose 3,5-epimerase [Petrotoga sp. HWHPT.55.6.3]RPD35598.1 hypothetical protein HWHPT5561_06625 [Petrotoga sp. HWH.PT.55.6.1]
MRIIQTNIEGLFVFENLPNFSDLRGRLFKPFSYSFFVENEDINTQIKEVWFTFSHQGVIRGMHLQIGEFACEKIVSVIQGGVQDVVLDLRKDSKTFKEVFEVTLNENENAIYIPKGCAHGYKVLRDYTITMYMATDIHSNDNDVGVKWDSFGYDWGIKNPILSTKDESLPSLEEFLKRYKI